MRYYFLNHCLLNNDSCLLNEENLCGKGMIYKKDPLFINPLDENFNVEPCSPVIDRGDISLLESILLYDKAGNLRVQNNQIDLGAYEKPTIDLTIDYATTNASNESAEDGIIEITMIEGGVPPYRFYWETGDTTNSIHQLSASTYTVLIQDAEGCQKEFVIPVDFTTATVFVATSEEDVIVYPNPSTTNTIFLRTTSNQPTFLKLTWYNSLGKLLSQQIIEPTSQADDRMLSLPATVTGIYWLQLENEKGQTVTKRVLIK